jgi:hypothetical protein
MIKMKVRRIKPILRQKLEIEAPVKRQAGELARDAIIDNIINGRQADGSQTKRTQEGEIPLIDKRRRFLDRGNWKIVIGPDSVTVQPAGGKFAQIVGWVQDAGFLGWLGVPDDVFEKIARLFGAEVEKKLG